MRDLREQLQQTLGDSYTLERELGGGGMSRVFVAHETALGRRVVIKVLAPELAAGVSLERFQREIKLAAALQHPNIVPVHASGATGELPYYTMPFVEGLSLRGRLLLGKPLPIGEVIVVLKDVARALTYAHDRGVIHRDIKPENVLFAGDAAVVTDFGIAKALQAARTAKPEGTLTQLGTSVGTPGYMSPEQLVGDPAIDHRADIYAFGCLAYELITGRTPFAGKLPHQLFHAQSTEDPPSIIAQRPDCPPALATLVMRCLAKDPDRRPQTAREIQRSLDALTSSSGGSRFSKRGRVAIATAGAGLTLLLVVLGFLAYARLRATPNVDRSVAVLPFESAGGDTTNAYFAEGIAEELITALSKIPGLRVTGRSSSFRFSGKAADSRATARALNVASLLEGTVRRSGSRMRVTVQLTNPEDGVVLWSESYEREIKDAFAVQDEITRAVVGALQLRLSPAVASSQQQLSSRKVDAAAYDAYLHGLALFGRRGKYVEQAVPFFEQAIARDSGFAPAYAQLAMALSHLPLYTKASYDTIRDRAFNVAERAIALEPGSGEAYAALGATHLFAFSDLKQAKRDFERATALGPNYSYAHYLFSVVLSGSGDHDRAVVEAKRAVEIDPVSSVVRFVLARDELQARLYEDAIADARRAVQLDSSFPLAPATLAMAEYVLGQRDAARLVALAAPKVPAAGPYLSYVLVATDDSISRRARLRALERDRRSNSHGEASLATAYLAAGDTARAFDALDRAAERREPVWAAAGFGSAVFDGVRESPRFTAVLRAYGLDPIAVNRIATRRTREH